MTSATLDIALLRSFVAIARSGSVTAAARQVGRSQSAVSMQMQRLEAVIGQPLLHRAGGGIALTTHGTRLLVHAESLLRQHDEALADLSATDLTGTISFGCPEDYLTAFFPELLRGFAEGHSGVGIEIVCAPTVELRPLLQRRRLDLALISLPEDAEPERILRYERIVWVAREPAPAILNQPVLPLALSAPDTLDHRAACDAMDRAGRSYRIAFASNSLAGLLAVTRSGQAISVTTCSSVPSDLSVLEEGLPPLPGLGISLAYGMDRPSRLVRAFGASVVRGLSR